MIKDLTFQEEYEVPIRLVLREFKTEYYQCGSHELEIAGITTLEHIQKLYDSLKTVKGLNP